MVFWMTLGERVKHDVSSALEPFLQQKQEIDKYKKQYRDLADPELCRRLQELRGKNPTREAGYTSRVERSAWREMDRGRKTVWSHMKMKRPKNFKTLESLAGVEKIINEAGAALRDTSRTIGTSSIPEVLGGVAGAGVGAAVSFAALYTLGTARTECRRHYVRVGCGRCGSRRRHGCRNRSSGCAGGCTGCFRLWNSGTSQAQKIVAHQRRAAPESHSVPGRNHLPAGKRKPCFEGTPGIS